MHSYADKSYYDGQWKDDYPNGKGIFVYSNGDMYTGSFINGVAHGEGVILYK